MSEEAAAESRLSERDEKLCAESRWDFSDPFGAQARGRAQPGQPGADDEHIGFCAHPFCSS